MQYRRYYRCLGCRRFTFCYGSTLDLAAPHGLCLHCGGWYALFVPVDGLMPLTMLGDQPCRATSAAHVRCYRG